MGDERYRRYSDGNVEAGTMTRTFDHDLLLRYLQEVYEFSRPVAEETIEHLRLDGDGLHLHKVLTECEEWNRQMIREATGGDE